MPVRPRAAIGTDVRTGRERRFPGRWFADCTGDGNLGYLAGADHRYGRESRAETGESLAPEKPDRQVMGASVMWRTKLEDHPVPFPDCPWAIQFNEKTYQRATSGGWNWETGFRWDQIDQFEMIRDHGLRAVFGNWAYQKNHARDKQRYANYRLEWVAYVAGKRESRRLLGDVILKQQDIVGRRRFEDACVTTTWSIDLHYPIQSNWFPGQEFRSRAEHLRIKPYAIPYRCLYSRNIEPVHGRALHQCHPCGLGDGSGDAHLRHDGRSGGHGGRRLQTPRRQPPAGLYRLSGRPQGADAPRRGAFAPPEWLDRAGPNLARLAAVSVSSRYSPSQYPPENVNDGRYNLKDNSLRFVSGPQLPGFVELSWSKPQRIGAVRILSGQAGSRRPRTPLGSFVIKYHDGRAWREIPATRAVENMAADWHARFPPVETRRLRLEVFASPGNLIRIWEWQVFGPVADKPR